MTTHSHSDSDLILDFIKNEWEPLLASKEDRFKKGVSLSEKTQLKPNEQKALSELGDQVLKMREIKDSLFRIAHGTEMIIFTGQEMFEDLKKMDIFDEEVLQPDLSAEQRGVLQKYLKRLFGYLQFYG